MALSLLLIGGLGCLRTCSKKTGAPETQNIPRVVTQTKRWEVRLYDKSDFNVPASNRRDNKTLELKAAISEAKRAMMQAKTAEKLVRSASAEAMR